MTIVAETTLILVDPVKNSNKFYRVELGSDDLVRCRYGRVGESGVAVAPQAGGRARFDSIVRSKTRKGYRPVETATSTGAGGLLSASRTSLVADADPETVALVDHLVAVNAHDIATTSGGRITVQDGQVTTPLGLLTTSALDAARDVLAEASRTRDEDELARLTTRYMQLVPQAVGRRRGWEKTILAGDAAVQAQSTFLDQLQASIELAVRGQGAPDTASFRYRLALVRDDAVTSDVQAMFDRSANVGHGDIARARVSRVFELIDSSGAAPAGVGNVRRMWHGSRAFNVLSILSTGLRIPPKSSPNVTGRMFGDGLYFSEQSTKSANYSRGGVWSSGRDNRWFMFVADVEMGVEFWPNRSTRTVSQATYTDVLDGRVTDGRGRVFTSINVRAGTCGVRNHEAIVPGPSQVALRYLVEFTG